MTQCLHPDPILAESICDMGTPYGLMLQESSFYFIAFKSGFL